MKKMFARLMEDESGASLIEYVLIAGLISIAGWGFLSLIGGDLKSILSNVQSATDSAQTTAAAGGTT